MIFPSEIAALIESAVQRTLDAATPAVQVQLARWMAELAGSEQPADYFRHPLAYPIFLLPWWAEKIIHPQPDLGFQADLAYSSVNIYYFIRMIDNVMDRRGSDEIMLLPALGYFHTHWQSVYQQYFAADHPFWEYFHRVWFASAEITIQDAQLTDIDLQQFNAISGRKVSAAIIPLAAVCYHYQQTIWLDLWTPFCQQFERWHQFYNDLFGWVGDYKNATVTYFLSEARRQSQTSGETLPGWVAREGFAWGVNLLHEWFVSMQETASPLHCVELDAYLAYREALLLQQSSEVMSRLASLAQLLDALDDKGK